MVDKVEHEFGRIKFVASYWSLHAYPHLVSTYGISRYASTSFLLKSVRLFEQRKTMTEPSIRTRVRMVNVTPNSRRVSVIHNNPYFFPGTILHPRRHVELTPNKARIN